MKIYIFDIDGTLTSTNPDLIKTAGHPTHAYWDLLTFEFIENKQALKDQINEWRQQVKTLDHEGFIASSAEMMQKALLQTTPHLTEEEVVQHAKKITHDFINAGVVIDEAIAFLNQKVEEGHTCILSTGSYESGAVGFLKALTEAGLISSAALDHIMVSGAVVDWKKKQLLHANIHNNKIKGLNALLQARHGFAITENTSHEIYVYADDPKGNDFGILSLAKPENRFVIANEKNHESEEFIRTTWTEIIEKTLYTTISFR